MSVQSVKDLFKKNNLENLVIYHDEISNTVENAAIMIGCKEEEIAKTMAFIVNDEVIVIVMAGDMKIDNSKYKNYFGLKAKMVPYDEVEKLTGHLPGGICPFALKDNIKVYLDVSLKRFDIVYTGGGDEHNIVKVTIKELEKFSNLVEFIDVCKLKSNT